MLIQFVGWVERKGWALAQPQSETHRLQFAGMMGFAKRSTHPTKFFGRPRIGMELTPVTTKEKAC
jgi:hypothetical protein